MSIRKRMCRAAMGAAALFAISMPLSASAQQDMGADEADMIRADLRSHEVVVNFAFDSAELDAEARRGLDQIAAWMKANPKRSLVVAGQTDKAGSEAYNFELGGERAMAAKVYLEQQGIAPERIVMVSFGEAMANQRRAERDRRVVFLLNRPDQMAGDDTEITYGEGETDYAAEPRGEGTSPETGLDQTDDFDPADDTTVAPTTSPATDYQQTKEKGYYGRDAEHLITPAGLSVKIGGGVMDFLDGDTRDFTSVAGTWEARVAYGTRSFIGFEAGYVGSAQSVDALGLDDNANLLGSAAEAAVRVNAPVMYNVQPYAFGGFGVTRYDIINADFNRSNLDDEETAFHVPLGVGVGFRYAGFLFDVRGTVRPMFGDTIGVGDDDLGADLGTWATTADIGWEF